MADANIQVKIAFSPPLENLAGQFRNFKMESALRDEISKILLRIESYSKQLTPVDTGRLRASEATSMLVDQIGGLVSTNVDYAIYVHEGTRYMRARPFLQQAAELVQPGLEGQLAARLDTEFTKTFKTL